MLLLVSTAVSTALAGALVGGAWTPLGTAAFSWSDADAFSGTLAGEFDGLLRPALTAHGGWVGEQDAVVGGLAFVAFRTRTFEDSSSLSVVGALRPELSYRRYLHDREPGRTNAYATGGLYGIVPMAADENDAYTGDEQADADEGSDGVKAQIGGLGGGAGVGAEYLFGDGQPTVAVGVRSQLKVYRGQATSETGYKVSTVWSTETALVVEFFL